IQQRCSAPEHALGKESDVGGCGKQPGMASYSSHHPGVFIVDFTLDDAMTENLIVLSRRNLFSLIRAWIEGHGLQAEWCKDLLTAKGVQSGFCDPFQGFAQQDESDVAIFGMRAGIVRKRHLACLLKQLVTGV